jgi:hypothetical protein
MIYFDGIRNVTLSNGDVRVELTATAGDGSETQVDHFVIPASRYGQVVEQLRQAGQQLQEKQKQTNKEDA